MPDDLWSELEQTPRHYPVEQEIVYELDVTDWFDGDRLGVDFPPHREVVCGCDPKFGYAIGHEKEDQE